MTSNNNEPTDFLLNWNRILLLSQVSYYRYKCQQQKTNQALISSIEE